MVIIRLHLFLFRSFPTHQTSGILPLDVTQYKKMTVTQKKPPPKKNANDNYRNSTTQPGT